MTKVLNFTHLLLLTALVGVFWGALTKLNLPLAEWEHITLAAAESWSKGINTPWIFDHPPLYPFFLTLVFKFTGPSQEVARSANLLLVILTCIVLFHFTADIFEKDTALWSVILYLLSAVCIQGIQLMDVADTSLLPLTFLLMANYIKNNISDPGPRNTTILSFMIALSLWAKVTSTLAFLIAVLFSYFYMFFLRRKGDQNPPTPLNIAALVFGLILFLTTWTLVSILLWGNEAFFSVLKAPWTAIHGRVAKVSYLPKIYMTSFEMIRLLVWFSPYLILMWLGISWRIFRTRPQSNDNHQSLKILIVCITIFYFFGNLIIGGTNWGYPRYHNAILPFICLFTGNYISISINKFHKNMLREVLIIISLSVIITVYLLKDPLLFLNLRFKELLLHGDGIDHVVKNAIMTFLPFYGLPIALVCLWLSIFRMRSRNRIYAILLIVCTLSTLLALDLQQIFASYRTSNQYGAVGKVEVLQKVRNHVRDGDYVFATPEFNYDLRDKKVSGIGWQIWKSKDIFYRLIESNTPQAIVAGLTVNTISQLKWLLSKDTQHFLSSDYDFITIGTYYLWLRTSTRN